ncbi:MAG TPA: TonB-dependent receptor [Terriglobales bacterium]|nr:TonB-dependent receptor [Terriglobales bacterium]
MKSSVSRLVLGLFLVVCSAASFGQAVFGSIAGTVSDPSGAAIAGAKITITETSKGVSYTTVSNESGNYVQSHLTVGNYDVLVGAPGFETYVRRNVRVDVDAVTAVSAQLTVGKVSEVVSVTGAEALLKTEKSDVSDTLEQKTVEEIPIYDRDVSRLYFLVPGIQATATTAASEQPQDVYRPKVNGAYWGGISFQLDGTDNRESVLGEPVITPKPDAISELKISTTSYDAEFGQASQAVIVASTKSGSNQLHGSAFDYRRDQHGQAKDPFTQSQPLPGKPGQFIPATLRNDFGGSIGGPIEKDKMFFFGDYEGTRQKLGNSQLLTVPTAAERGGNLSDLGVNIYDPCPAGNPNCGTAVQAPGARTQFPGNVIPTARLSPQAQALLNFIPMPNVAGAAGGTPNYVANGTGIVNSNSFDVRIDRHQGQKLDLFGRYSLLKVEQSSPGAFGLVAGGPNFSNPNFSGTSSLQNQSLAYGTTYVINNSWVADFRFGFFRYRVLVNPNGLGTSPAKDAGIPGLNLDSYYTSGMPGMTINQLGSPTFAFGYSLGENQCNCPLNEQENEFQYVGNLTHTFGNHSLKFGVDVRHAQNLRVPSDFHRSGLLNFDAVGTSGPTGGGLGLASFLLGDVTGTSPNSPNATFYRYVSNSTDAAERQNRLFSYVQDTWRFTPKLTLNYGLRWDIYFPQYVNTAGAGGFVNINTGEVLVAGQNGTGLNGNVNTDYKHFAPRLGIAYQMTPKTVVRAGYGRSYDVGVFGVSFGHNVTQNLPVLASQSINPTQPYAPVFTLAQGPPSVLDPAAFLAAQPKGPTGNPLLPNGISAKILPLSGDNTMRLPTTDAWNLTVERQVTQTLVVSAAYVGSKEEHVTPGGTNYNTNEPQLNLGLPPTNTNLRRYYFQKFGWSQSLNAYTDDATVKYNALQLRVDKRFSNGLSFQGNFTWASAFDFTNDYFFWDRRIDYGRESGVRREVFNLTHVYELPFGRGKPLFGNSSGLLDYLIGGWQYSGVWFWGSGLPFTPSYNECGADIDTGPCRANLVGNAAVSNPGTGTSIGGGPVQNPWFVVATPAGASSGCKSTTTFAFDQNGCTRGPWQRPAVGTFGNVGLSSFYGPRFFNLDSALSKRLKITERVNAQFRAELFNTFNDVNLGQPNGNVDSKTAGQITSLATSSNAQMRRWQLGLRVEF